ncbi:hypothetical protein HNR60_001148 [Rhodopseudomonas rhenobacensis]|uniref:Uncharacterized protein n=1 Tax=Rhodopseudomonas rhenobacensis TaxID=87461 RepID=A0A7W7Z1Q0_9BRAD|nr:hypothetical protein [Rhodopseudomonas rhenobacensis]MBB5046403.1 hypothetical protein [Rhodopseudomonas rhenobacensis]
MICSERSTRVLPGLSQALSWLRSGLPRSDGAPQPVRTSTLTLPRPPRHRPTGAAQKPAVR